MSNIVETNTINANVQEKSYEKKVCNENVGSCKVQVKRVRTEES